MKKKEKVRTFTAQTALTMLFSVSKKWKKMVKTLNSAVRRSLRREVGLSKKAVASNWNWSTSADGADAKLRVVGPIIYKTAKGAKERDRLRSQLIAGIVVRMADVGSMLKSISLNGATPDPVPAATVPAGDGKTPDLRYARKKRLASLKK